MRLLDSIINKKYLSPSKTNLIKNLYWASLGKVCNLASGLIVGIIVARYLGPEQYGLMNYVISYVFLFQTIAVFGLDSIEVREEAKNVTDNNNIMGTAFVLKLILGVIMMIATIITSLLIESDSYTTILVGIYSLTIVLNSFNVIRNYFTSIVQNEYIVKAEISRTAIGIGLKLVLLFFKSSLTVFVIAYMIDYLLLASGYYMAYKYKVGRIKDWIFDCEYAKKLLKASFPLMLTSTAVLMYQRIDQVMIGQMLNKESVGYFAIASRFVEVLIYVPMVLAQTIMPILVKYKEESKDLYIEKSQKFMNISFWSTLILSALTSLLAWWIVNLTFGKNYLPAVIILQIMSFKAASVALSNTAGTMIIIEGKQKYAIVRDLIGCVVCVSLNSIMLPKIGILAAAIIAIISNIAAGYIADAFIPSYRRIFLQQTQTLIMGWKDILTINTYKK